MGGHTRRFGSAGAEPGRRVTLRAPGSVHRPDQATLRYVVREGVSGMRTSRTMAELSLTCRKSAQSSTGATTRGRVATP